MLEFPDNGARPEPVRPWSVSRLNREVRARLENGIGEVWIEGEVSNHRRQPSGHHYFSLKDETSQVACVLFRSAAAGAGASVLRDGVHVEVYGDLTVYEARGQYQVLVRRVQARGQGQLEARLRELQQRLRAEGLFDPARKRSLPVFPRRVGVVTSPSGAAIRDFLKVLRRRAPHVEVFVAPVRVQGRGAGEEIAAALRQFGDPAAAGFPAVDVVVLTRGGGSLEDLWEFNSEAVARAVAASPLPVISAVGHEIDFTTADLAADVRAPTPSVAAEIVCPDGTELLRQIAHRRQRLVREVENGLALRRARLDRRRESGVFLAPARRLAEARLRLDERRAAMEIRAAALVTAGRHGLRHAMAILRAREPAALLVRHREQVRRLRTRTEACAAAAWERMRLHLAHRRRALAMLSPMRTLERGYTITLDERRQPLTTAAEARRADRLTTLFADGEVASHPLPPGRGEDRQSGA